MFAIKPNTQVNTNRPATNETPQTHDNKEVTSNLRKFCLNSAVHKKKFHLHETFFSCKQLKKSSSHLRSWI